VIYYYDEYRLWLKWPDGRQIMITFPRRTFRLDPSTRPQVVAGWPENRPTTTGRAGRVTKKGYLNVAGQLVYVKPTLADESTRGGATYWYTESRVWVELSGGRQLMVIYSEPVFDLEATRRRPPKRKRPEQRPDGDPTGGGSRSPVNPHVLFARTVIPAMDADRSLASPLTAFARSKPWAARLAIRTARSWIDTHELSIRSRLAGDALAVWEHFAAQTRLLGGGPDQPDHARPDASRTTASAVPPVDWTAVLDLWRTYQQVTALAADRHWPAPAEVFGIPPTITTTHGAATTHGAITTHGAATTAAADHTADQSPFAHAYLNAVDTPARRAVLIAAAVAEATNTGSADLLALAELARRHATEESDRGDAVLVTHIANWLRDPTDLDRARVTARPSSLLADAAYDWFIGLRVISTTNRAVNKVLTHIRHIIATCPPPV
jgi:hypothetical protein